jgi:hypothetical protein
VNAERRDLAFLFLVVAVLAMAGYIVWQQNAWLHNTLADHLSTEELTACYAVVPGALDCMQRNGTATVVCRTIGGGYVIANQSQNLTVS